MGSGNSGIYAGTRGSRTQTLKAHSEEVLHSHVSTWAKSTATRLANQSKRQRDLFNTACVVIDVITGKYYYGRNKGMTQGNPPPKQNPILFGDSTHPGLLPKISLNGYSIGNCAEVHAVNAALNDGAKLKNLYMVTIHATEGKMGEYKKGCKNCKATFKKHIKKNYSGWI